MSLIYKPFGLVFGILAGLLGKRAFEAVWTRIDDQQPPEATTRETSWRKVLAVAVLQGAIFTAVRFAVDRAGATSFHYLTGFWPGEEHAPLEH